MPDENPENPLTVTKNPFMATQSLFIVTTPLSLLPSIVVHSEPFPIKLTDLFTTTFS